MKTLLFLERFWDSLFSKKKKKIYAYFISVTFFKWQYQNKIADSSYSWLFYFIKYMKFSFVCFFVNSFKLYVLKCCLHCILLLSEDFEVHFVFYKKHIYVDCVYVIFWKWNMKIYLLKAYLCCFFKTSVWYVQISYIY